MSRSSISSRSIPCLLGLVAWLLALPALAEPSPLPPQPIGVPWPTVEWSERGAPADAEAALAAASDALFESVGRGGLHNTRAFLVVHRGAIVHERYAEGFGRESRFHSWSMAKSLTQALVGILVGDGRLALDERAPVAAWSDPADPRHAITLRHLLNMTSGLDNADGGADPSAFVGRLFFGDLRRDMARASAERELLHPPGTHWAYSSGTGSILAAIVGRTVGGEVRGVLDFMERRLFAPLGVRSLVPEFDRAGTFVGGGFAWANARDWARLGLLYLRDGVWDGTRILPEGWVDFSRTAAPAANNATHGAHFWISGEPAEGQFEILREGIDSFMMTGNGGQIVSIVPARDLLLVRLGEMHGMTWPEIHAPLSDVIEAFPRVGEGPGEATR